MSWLWLGTALACSPGSQVSFADVTLAWHVDEHTLHGQVRAPGPGWVAIGFDDREGLAGSRLVMLAVRDGAVVGEEHRAEPPDHPVRRVLSEEHLVGRLDDRGLLVTFEIPLESPDLTLASGLQVYLTLAWSRSPDFDHHSARREARWVRL